MFPAAHDQPQNNEAVRISFARQANSIACNKRFSCLEPRPLNRKQFSHI